MIHFVKKITIITVTACFQLRIKTDTNARKQETFLNSLFTSSSSLKIGQRENPFGIYTANEGPVRIQDKCLVPICVCFPRNETVQPRSLIISKQNYMFFLPIPILIYRTCERFLHFLDQSVYFAASKYVDQSWEYIKCSQHMKVGIGTEAAQLFFCENIKMNFWFSVNVVLQY